MSKRILVVDDDAMSLKMSAFVLQKFCDVLTAQSGEECMKLLENETVDGILLDVEMPGMNGYETLAAIRRQQRFDDIPVVFLTGTDGVDGGHKYIQKPMRPAEAQKMLQQEFGV